MLCKVLGWPNAWPQLTIEKEKKCFLVKKAIHFPYTFFSNFNQKVPHICGKNTSFLKISHLFFFSSLKYGQVFRDFILRLRQKSDQILRLRFLDVLGYVLKIFSSLAAVTIVIIRKYLSLWKKYSLAQCGKTKKLLS